MTSPVFKVAAYVGIFAFGYAAGHLNNPQYSVIPKTQESKILQTPNATAEKPLAAVNCPADSQPPTQAGFKGKSVAAEVPASSPDNRREHPAALAVSISDFDNPDEQIRQVLTEASHAFTQTNEQLVEDPDPLDPIFRLTEDQQLAYVQKLVESQEDSAIVALNDLILNDNPPIQHAAIDGLIALLEMRTGHFAMIAENLEQNAVFLDGEQLRRLEKITQAATAP